MINDEDMYDEDSIEAQKSRSNDPGRKLRR